MFQCMCYDSMTTFVHRRDLAVALCDHSALASRAKLSGFERFLEVLHCCNWFVVGICALAECQQASLVYQVGELSARHFAGELCQMRKIDIWRKRTQLCGVKPKNRFARLWVGRWHNKVASE